MKTYIIKIVLEDWSKEPIRTTLVELKISNVDSIDEALSQAQTLASAHLDILIRSFYTWRKLTEHEYEMTIDTPDNHPVHQKYKIRVTHEKEYNKPMEKIHYKYEGYHKCKSQCYIQMKRRENGSALVIATEDLEQTGTSITNRAEHIATHICIKNDIDPSRMLWIEHYPPTKPKSWTFSNHTYNLISFRISIAGKFNRHPITKESNPEFLSNPEWQHLTKERLTEIEEEWGVKFVEEPL